VADSNKTAANKRLYASWAFSNGPSALVFQMSFSNLALANRVIWWPSQQRELSFPTLRKASAVACKHLRK